MEQSGGRSCFNNYCDAGMIVIRHDYPLGMALPASIRGAETSNYAKFNVYKVFLFLNTSC